MEQSRGPWRLKQLVALARDLQEEAGASGDSKRVRWKPTERLVRYYTTLGLIDGPTEMRGRTAYYSARHILQLLAIKKLQAEGWSLEEIQPRLVGLTSRELERMVGLEPGWLQTQPQDPSPRSRFWAETPRPSEWKIEPAKSAGFPLKGIELAPGITVMIDAKIHPNADPDEIRRAASGLLEYLDKDRP